MGREKRERAWPSGGGKKRAEPTVSGWDSFHLPLSRAVICVLTIALCPLSGFSWFPYLHFLELLMQLT